MTQFRRLIIPFITLFSMATLSSQTPDKRGFIISVGDTCPDFTLELVDGKVLQKTDLLGKVVVLQFTASWCSVCRKEMPHLEKEVWQEFQGDDFILIGVDRDEPRKVVEKFANDMKITYPMALDPGANIFGLFAHKESGVTRNVVIDKEGQIRFLTRLYNKKEFRGMIRVIEKLLQK